RTRRSPRRRHRRRRGRGRGRCRAARRAPPRRRRGGGDARGARRTAPAPRRRRATPPARRRGAPRGSRPARRWERTTDARPRRAGRGSWPRDRGACGASYYTRIRRGGEVSSRDADTGESVAGSAGTAAERASRPTSPGSRVGAFVVTGVLGRDATGVVVSAHDPDLDREVAIKLLHPAPGAGGAPGEAQARLLAAAQAMAKISHPGVITVHQVGTIGDDVFVVMEKVGGRTLRAWLDEKERTW